MKTNTKQFNIAVKL